MKSLLLALLAATLVTLLLIIAGRAKDIHFEWDANTDAVAGYSLWLHTFPVPEFLMPEPIELVPLFVKSTTVDGSVLTAVIPGLAPGKHEVYLTAFNADGLESDPSNTVSFTVVPAPKGFRVVLQASSDMEHWETLSTHDEPAEGRHFFRAQFAPLTDE